MRFAGQCIADVADNGVIFDDLCVVGEYPHVYDDLESEIDDLKNDEEIKKLSKGLYHVFFYGQYVWEVHEHWEYDIEYDIAVTEWDVIVFDLKGETNDY